MPQYISKNNTQAKQTRSASHRCVHLPVTLIAYVWLTHAPRSGALQRARCFPSVRCRLFTAAAPLLLLLHAAAALYRCCSLLLLLALSRCCSLLLLLALYRCALLAAAAASLPLRAPCCCCCLFTAARSCWLPCAPVAAATTTSWRH